VLEVIEIGPLFGASGLERDEIDAAVGAAASTIGVLLIGGPAGSVPCDAVTRESMLRVFSLAPAQQRALWRRSYARENEAVYRGWSPREGEVAVDIYDLGPDIAHERPDASDDPLLGLSPLPALGLLPGWLEAAADYYRAMERVGAALMHSLARWLGLRETVFDAAFAGGISTLRLMRYELAPAPAAGNAEPRAQPRRGEHVDSGFVRLLAQHGVGGLQAQTGEGEWVAIPVLDEAIVVNFGALLERWTSGRVRATPHRVLSAARTRYSIPFFYEPRVDAVIEPLPLPNAVPFEPFSYGDHLWSAMAAFPNFADIAYLRTPRGIAGA
jgi:isopenicillin N synthase-like dioxygenase